MNTQEYLAAIHLALVESPIVAGYAIVRQRVASVSGYLRVRIRLVNGDFLEAAEFFELTSGDIQVSDYRHQWMDGLRAILHKRWDSAPHHPEVERAPHHCHDGSEDRVIPGQPMSIAEVLTAIASEIRPGEMR
jgi:hypothetical protein